MMLGTFPKQPTDVLDYDITYADWMVATDDLASWTVAIAPTGTAGDLANDSVFNNDPVLKLWMSGGRNGITYKVTVTTTTTAGRIKQDEFKLKVRDL